MKKSFLILYFLAFIFLNKEVLAINQNDILINEVAWMGNTNSANDEWIELFNNTESAINLDGWVLKSDDGTPEIKLLGSITPNSFYLLERTNDDSIPNIKADKVYSGALSNSGENLILYDDKLNVIDRASFASGWTFGNKDIKQTMERANLTSWQTSKNPNGTPQEKNSSGAIKIVKTTSRVDKSLLKTEKSDNKTSVSTTASLDNSQKLIDNIINNQKDGLSSWALFLIIGGIILIMGTCIIFWKLKSK